MDQMLLNKCFVIMPFSDTSEFHTETYWTNHFSQFIEPLIKEKLNIPVMRSSLLRTDIIKDIIRDLVFSKLVIADITDFNPNVLWELGVRHSFTNGTIIIAEKNTDRPFDISKNPILEYPSPTDPNYESEKIKFKKRFFTAISDWEDNPTKYDSPVLEALSGRGTIHEIIFKEEIMQKMNGFLQELSYNQYALSQFVSTILNNQNDYTINSAPTHRISTCATELLITTRYLNEDLAFYTKIINYNTIMNAINGQISLWLNGHYEVQEWLLNSIKQWEKPIEELIKLSNKKYSNLQNSI